MSLGQAFLLNVLGQVWSSLSGNLCSSTDSPLNRSLWEIAWSPPTATWLVSFTFYEIRVRQANDLCFLDRVPAARERWRSFPSCSCLSSSPCCWWSGTAFQVLLWHIFVLGSFWFNSFPWLGVTICALFATRSIILRQVLAWHKSSINMKYTILLCHC